jgi:4-hydroxyphenylpyruvate dioxygenase
MCWSTYAWRWQDSWRLVKAVDRPNFGLVLDAFHIAGWEFADPTIEGGIRPDGSSRLEESLKELVASVNGKRIFYVQLVDAEKQDLPIAKDTGNPYYNPGQQPRMSWSRNCRVFPYEEDRGAHMPIEQVCKAFLETGFSGWIR